MDEPYGPAYIFPLFVCTPMLYKCTLSGVTKIIDLLENSPKFFKEIQFVLPTGEFKMKCASSTLNSSRRPWRDVVAVLDF